MSFLQKVLEVFTKEYRQETECREQLRKNLDKIKLKSNGRDDLLKRLEKQMDNNFQSDFRVEEPSNPISDKEKTR